MPSILARDALRPAPPAAGVLLLFLGSTGCGLVFHAGKAHRRPGVALRSFQAAVGAQSSAATPASERDLGATPYPLTSLTPAEIRAFRAEADGAVQGVRSAMAGGANPDLLPTGRSRSDRFARAWGLAHLFRRPERAEELLVAILEESPRWFPAVDELANVKLALLSQPGARREATLLCREVARAIGDTAQRIRLARVLESSGRPEDEAEGYAILQALAQSSSDDDVAAGARELAAWYLARYRAPEAEAVVRRALGRRPGDGRLILALAQAIRFQGHMQDAFDVLRPLAENGTGTLQARALLQQVWALRGLRKFDGALALLERLLGSGAGPEASLAPFVTHNRAMLEQLRGYLREEKTRGARVAYSVDELRYLLRESTDASQRQHALGVLVRNAQSMPSLTRDLVFAAKHDPDASVRLDAIIGMTSLNRTDPQPIRIGLADPDPRNRTVAADRALNLPRAVAVPLLIEALDREQDPNAFLSIHARLAKITGEVFFLGRDRVATGEQRAGVCAEWRRRLKLEGRRKAGSTDKTHKQKESNG